VWRLPLAGGEAERVTDLPLDAANLVVSPDGGRLAFTMEVFPDCADLDCTVKRLGEREEGRATGRLYTDLLFRHWDAWDDDRRSHLFTLALGDGRGEDGAAPVDLVRGVDADVPSQPFGGSEEIAFSPDGKSVVFARREAGAGEAWSTDFDLYRAPTDGSAVPELLTADNEAWDTGPVFSPDGSTLAYLAMARPDFEADRFRIRLRDMATGAVRDLAADWDRSPGGLAFSPDGGTLYATASNVGHTSLFAVDVASGAVETVQEAGTVRSPQVLPGGAGPDRILFGMDTLTSPVELYTLTRVAAAPAQLTHFNRDALAAVELGEPEQFHFEGAGGDRVWGWVVKPAGFEAGKTYPIAFLIHGGPQGSFGNDFHYRWNPQTYAGAGYAAVMIDFHGSVGYGQDFVDAIRDDWGGKPLEDLRKGLAAAIARYPWLDGDRACALGASYGGYMVNWIAGSWPDRFRCLVNHDGLFDQRMMYYATEELWFPEWEHMGPYWAAPEAHERHNPVHHVESWKTPMLVVHGGLDFRVPETQSFATFTALRRRGVPAQLLYFPDENHWVLQPANSILWHDTVFDWLDRWLKP
jgi:dipeptidyl aminopeptidase/acylaminoacyl peptidase